ncbi:MAG: hypothetical protein AAFP98_05425 [Pseudomonadota bacterium]
MTPNFALLLSSDGIVLLQRVPEGWERVGAARLEAEDLNAEMAALRDRATELADGELRTKLILPDDQIRYLAIDTARTSQDDINAAVQDATPLALDEVQIDFDQSGGRTYIAAVAKQTLLEAETFAQEHRFHPVAFAALAEPYTFRHAVSFGTTAYAEEALGGDVTLEPIDAETLRQALRGPAIAQTAPVATQDPTIRSTEEFAEDNVPLFVSRNSSTVAPPTAQVSEKVAEEPAPIPEFKRSTSRRPVRSRPTEEATKPSASPKPAAARPKRDEDPAFVTRRTLPGPDLALERGLVGVGGSERRSPLVPVALVACLLAAIGGVGVWTTRALDTNLAGLFTLDPGLQDDGTAPAAAIAETTAPAPAPAPEPAAPTVAAAAPELVDETPVADEEVIPPTPIVTAIPGRVLSPADAARIYAATGVWQRAPRLPDRNGDKQGTLDGIHTFATLPAAAQAPMPGRPDSASGQHELQMIAPLNPRPLNRPLPRDEDGFILATAVGTVLPTGVPIYGRAPSSRPPLRPTDEPVYLRDDSIPLVQLDVVTGVELVSFTAESAAPSARSFAAPVLSQPQPVLGPLNAQPQALPNNIAAITTPADPLPPEPAPEIMDQMPVVAAAPAAPTPEQLIGTSFDNPSQADAPFNQQAPTQAKAAIADQPLPSPPLDNEGAPVGVVVVIQGAPDVVPPLRPGSGANPANTQDAVTADPEIDIVADEDLPDAENDLPLIANAIEQALAENDTTDTAAANDDIASTDADAQTLAEAVEAALEDVVPAPLPQDPALAGFRPSLRPADLLPASARTFEAIPALAAFRPTIRPDGLAPQPEPEPEVVTTEPVVATPDNIAAIVASIADAAPPSLIVSPTARAISLSPRPDPRPQNFARVVAAAQAITARQQPATPQQTTRTAAVVQTPAPQTAPATGGRTGATVARAATIDNVIALRDMNLIGVYGKPGARRALVRMPNGRFVKVEVGSSLDGGRVTAINDSALNFVKRGRTYALQLPAG